MSAYPEHDKMTEVAVQSQAIGEFLEWLAEKHIVLARYRDDITDSRVCSCRGSLGDRDPKPNCQWCSGSGWHTITLDTRLEPESYSITKLLAEHFDIDLVKIEQEKRAMLDDLRGAQRAHA